MAVERPEEGRFPPPEWETIEQVFAALESPLLAYGRQLSGDFNVAEDIVQEAFMKLHTQFEKIRAPRPWLYRTVHNLAIDHQRRVSRLVPLAAPGGEDEPDAAEAGDPQPLPDEQIVRGESIGLVRLVLETLDVRSREVIRLRFLEDLSYREISARTGLAVGHVGYLLHHALKAMALELDRTGVTP